MQRSSRASRPCEGSVPFASAPVAVCSGSFASVFQRGLDFRLRISMLLRLRVASARWVTARGWQHRRGTWPVQHNSTVPLGVRLVCETSVLYRCTCESVLIVACCFVTVQYSRFLVRREPTW